MNRDARDAALALLARRSHTRLELSRKLSRKGFPSGEIAPVLEDLTERGYLDDARTAAALAAAQAGRGRGRARIASELSARGVAPPERERALAGLDPAAERQALRRALERKARALPAGLTPGARSKKLFDHLVRRGFAPTAVLEALHRKGETSDDDREEVDV
ncbi:MAG TPA: regulatory protein RecX [Thermoanaerobaculia bacterium]|nr:regulatory protein RecX [Thermoanaerobaculia bacterium]